MQAILIWFDRLPYGLLECCGNTGGRTPGFNRLAAECATFDRCFAADFEDGVSGDMVRSLTELAQAGIGVRVMTEGETRLGEHLRRPATAAPDALEVTNRVSIDDAIKETLDAAADSGSERSGLTVISLTGVPSEVVDWQSDEAAAAMAHADDVIGQIVTALQTAGPSDDLLLLVAASAGLAADPTSAGSLREGLKEKAIHVPMFGRIGLGPRYGVRYSTLVCTGDVPATVAAYFGRPALKSRGLDLGANLRGGDSPRRDALLIGGEGSHCGLLRADWYLMTEWPDGPSADVPERLCESASLFMKPDDLWDQLDVAGQSREVVEELVAQLVGEYTADRMIPRLEGETRDSGKIAEDFD